MKHRVFIGSSVEGKELANAIQVGLNYDARPVVWHQAFQLSRNTLDTLLDYCANNDFAVFVFSPDDTAVIRKKEYEIARDNVLFEAGLFMGRQGASRVFIVTPQDSPSFHLLTDLLGFTSAKYDADWAKQNPNAALGATVTQILQAIRASVSAYKRLDIEASPSLNEAANFRLKLNLSITNNLGVTLFLESIEFDFGADAFIDPNAKLQSGVYRPKFLVRKEYPSGKDIYESICILRPGASIQTWVPFDPKQLSLDKLKSLGQLRTTGTWHYRCVQLDKLPNSHLHEEKL